MITARIGANITFILNYKLEMNKKSLCHLQQLRPNRSNSFMQIDSGLLTGEVNENQAGDTNYK